ncbi:MAG: anthranilate phosphoribosyltransferase [Gemmatimonadales bacterium]
MPNVAPPLAEALRLLSIGRSLTASQSAAAFAVLVAGEAADGDAASLLMGLKRKGETADEIAGAALVLREAMIPLIVPDRDDLVDTCGTGGGLVGTLNISTAAAILAVGAGVRVAKHGNRSHTSRSGSADVLEALGVAVELRPPVAAKALETSGFTFMYAPQYHPAMRHVAGVRRQLGVATMMNLLGPLANPAGVGRQVVGVAERRVAPLLADALRRLGTRHAMVVHAEVGMDEISPMGATEVWEVRGSAVREWLIEPAEFGLEVSDLTPLAGGEPDENANRIERLLEGADADHAARSALVLNAGAALYVAGVSAEFPKAVDLARRALTAGTGRDALSRIRAAVSCDPAEAA